MSTKCLVTELNGVVDNEELLKVGEFKVNIIPDSNSKRTFFINFSTETTLRIIGNGTFDNGSKSITISANTNTDVKISNTNCTLVIPNKYNIQNFNCDTIKGLSFDIEALRYTKQMYNLVLTEQCYGDLSAISHLKSITFLVIPSIKGDIALLKNFNVTYIQANKLYGNLGEAISTMPSIKNLNLNGSNELYGDISKAPKSLSYMGNDFSGSFSWKGERDSSYPIISMLGGFVFGEDLDAMLINQAKCQVTNETYKLIVVRGTRTSASDEAISTLQSKGYSVYIQ